VTNEDLAAKATALAALHVPGDPLVLPNAWDAASAVAFAEAGSPAVATSSGAVAVTLGFEDHEDTPPDEMFAAVGRIAGAVEVPVTADVERGYGLSAEELVERLLAAGAAGCNLEDSQPSTGQLVDPDEQAVFLEEVRAAAAAFGVPLVINARVDTFIRTRGEQDDLVADAAARAARYLEAGATCVYPIFLQEDDALTAFVQQVDGPVNALFLPERLSIPQLGEAGVARITFGSGLHGAASRTVHHLAERVAAGQDPYAG
jgi:2-methylisocitrate lyase-like PEP mutase family enzyme